MQIIGVILILLLLFYPPAILLLIVVWILISAISLTVRIMSFVHEKEMMLERSKRRKE